MAIFMDFESFKISFIGYWLQAFVRDMPSEPGVFCVYNGIFQEQNNTVSLNKLLYIEDAKDINAQIKKHLDSETWNDWILSNEQLCFSCATDSNISVSDWSRICDALIYKHKPLLNLDQKKDTPPQVRTYIEISGDRAQLYDEFMTPF